MGVLAPRFACANCCLNPQIMSWNIKYTIFIMDRAGIDLISRLDNNQYDWSYSLTADHSIVRLL